MYQLAGQSWVYAFQLGFHLIVKKRFRWSQSSLNTKFSHAAKLYNQDSVSLIACCLRSLSARV